MPKLEVQMVITIDLDTILATISDESREVAGWGDEAEVDLERLIEDISEDYPEEILQEHLLQWLEDSAIGFFPVDNDDAESIVPDGDWTNFPLSYVRHESHTNVRVI